MCIYAIYIYIYTNENFLDLQTMDDFEMAYKILKQIIFHNLSKCIYWPLNH